MIKNLAKCLFAISILACPYPALATEGNADAKPPPLKPLKISRSGDIELSCGELSQESAAMRDVIYTMQDVKNASEMQSHGVTAAGAVGSLLIGTVTGGIGLAVGGFLLDYNIDEHEEAADDLQDTAAQRRTLMMGIYNAKGCFGPIEHAMQNPKAFSLKDTITAEIAHTPQQHPRTAHYNN